MKHRARTNFSVRETLTKEQGMNESPFPHRRPVGAGAVDRDWDRQGRIPGEPAGTT